MSDDNPTDTNEISNLHYVFEPRWGDARFDKHDVLQLSDLEEKEKVQVFFAGSNQVLLGRALPRATDSVLVQDFEADSTNITVSAEFRQRLLESTAVNKDEAQCTDTLPNADLPIIDLQPFGADKCGVSRKHAVLQWDARYVTITDLKSTNGTRINGSLLYPMQRRILRNGDELQIGGLQFLVRFRRPELSE